MRTAKVLLCTIILLIVFACLSLPCSAQVIVHGIIVYEDTGNPVSGVYVYTSAGSFIEKAITNSSGKWEIGQFWAPFCLYVNSQQYTGYTTRIPSYSWCGLSYKAGDAQMDRGTLAVRYNNGNLSAWYNQGYIYWSKTGTLTGNIKIVMHYQDGCSWKALTVTTSASLSAGKYQYTPTVTSPKIYFTVCSYEVCDDTDILE